MVEIEPLAGEALDQGRIAVEESRGCVEDAVL